MEKKSIHFNGSTQNTELLLHMSEELPVGQRAVEKPKAPGQLDKVEIITQPPLAEMQTNEERQGNLLQEYEQRFEKLSEDQKLSRLCSEAGLRFVKIEQFFYALRSPRGKENQSLCREYTMARDSNLRFGPVSDMTVCNHYGRYSIEVQVNLCFKIKPYLGFEL